MRFHSTHLTPGATGVVVVIVTSLVSLPGWFSTGFFHFGNACVACRFVVAVFAFTFFTEVKSFCTTTVTGVPIASYTQQCNLKTVPFMRYTNRFAIAHELSATGSINQLHLLWSLG